MLVLPKSHCNLLAFFPVCLLLTFPLSPPPLPSPLELPVQARAPAVRFQHGVSQRPTAGPGCRVSNSHSVLGLGAGLDPVLLEDWSSRILRCWAQAVCKVVQLQVLCRISVDWDLLRCEAQLELVMITCHFKHHVKAIYGSFVWRNRHFPTPCPNIHMIAPSLHSLARLQPLQGCAAPANGPEGHSARGGVPDRADSGGGNRPSTPVASGRLHRHLLPKVRTSTSSLSY